MKKFFLLVAMLCVMFSSSAFAADWIQIYSDDFSTVYLDNDSFNRDLDQEGYVFHAVIKEELTETGRADLMDRFSKHGLNPAEIQNVAHMTYVQYYKLDNGTKYCATFALNCYAADGTLLKEISNNNLSWEAISAGSGEEVKFDQIAKRLAN